MRSFRATLLALMRSRSLSQSALARASGIAPAALGHYLHGRDFPRAEAYLALHAALKPYTDNLDATWVAEASWPAEDYIRRKLQIEMGSCWINYLVKKDETHHIRRPVLPEAEESLWDLLVWCNWKWRLPAFAPPEDRQYLARIQAVSPEFVHDRFVTNYDPTLLLPLVAKIEVMDGGLACHLIYPETVVQKWVGIGK